MRARQEARTPRRVGAVLLILALAGPGALAGQRHASQQRVANDNPLHDLSAAIAEQRLTVEELARIRHRLLTKPLSGVGMISVADLTRGVAEAEERYRTLLPTRVGDLDGDGGDDVLAIESATFGALDRALEARRGSDGALLWSESLRYDDYLAHADLSGDGVSDLVVFQNRALVDDGGLNPLGSHPGRLQRLRLLDGRDGAELWSQLLPAARLGAGVHNVPFANATVAAAHDLVLGIALRPDADGDGMSDIHVDAITFGVAFGSAGIPFLTGASVGAGHVRYQALTFSGVDGAQIGRVTFDDILAPGIGSPVPFAIPAPDLSGDGLGDLVAFGALDVVSSSVSALSVHGVPYWRIPAEPNASVRILRPVSAGPADVLVAWVDSSFRLWHDLHAGPDGAQRWRLSHPGSVYPATVIDDLDGDGGQDVVFSQFNAFPERGVAAAYSGANAAPLWTFLHQPVISGTEFATVGLCQCPSDLDGDGAPDLLFEEVVYRQNSLQVLRRSRGAMSGASGTSMWFAPVLGPAVPAGGDADGDGTNDVFVFDTSSPAAEARDGADFSLLWEHPLPVPATLSVSQVLGADLTGDDGVELILSTGLGRLVAVGAGGVLWAL